MISTAIPETVRSALGALLIAWLGISSSMLSAKPSDFADDKQPNIVIVLVDDFGYADTSSYGSPPWQTPNIDKIVTGGARFTTAYSAAPICTPTRASC
jgi:hypothetical protein